jgi:hypothetical protein
MRVKQEAIFEGHTEASLDNLLQSERFQTKIHKNTVTIQQASEVE